MKAGDDFAGRVIEHAITPTLYRVRDADGRSSWLRVGPPSTRVRAEALVNTTVEGVGPFHLCEDGEQVGLIGPAEFGTPLLAATRAQLFGGFQSFADVIQRLHGSGLLLAGIEPEAVRLTGAGVLLVPALEPVRPWVAPEGPVDAASDWFLFGLLIYAALTGTSRFPWYGQTNGPDPRDRSPRSPEILSALAMDLLLLEPGDRPDGYEVIEDLIEPSEGPVEDAVDRLLREGGLAVLPTSWEARVEDCSSGLHLDQAPGEVVRLVETVSALPKRARAQIAALLEHPDALSPAHRARAARHLGQALAISGVRLAWWSAADPVQHSIVVDVLRAQPCPVVVVLSDEPLPGLVDVCKASGIRVHGDPRTASEALEGLPFTKTESVLWDGRTQLLNQQLLELGVPKRQGFTGRAVDTMADWVGPTRPHGTLLDASRPRRAGRLASELAWVRPERAVLVARWSWREAMRAGDPEAGAILHLVDAILTGGLPSGEPDGEHAEDVLVFGRALAHRHRGDAKAVISVLEDALPLVSLGAAENGAAGLLVAEALVDTGAWKRAGLVLRSLQVDARRTGNRLLDLGCLALAQCMGFDVKEELEAVAREVDPGHGFVAWWLARARALERLDDPVEAAALLTACRVFELWPLRLAGAPAVEARMLRMQIGWLAGEPVVPIPFVHPSAEAWRALADAVDARRRGEPVKVMAHLDTARQRFEGAHATLHAMAVQRLRGMWLGGPRGGTLVAGADEALAKQGRFNPAKTMRLLLPGIA